MLPTTPTRTCLRVVTCLVSFVVHKMRSVRGGTSNSHRSHHSIIPQWIYRIPSELRSQALLGPISTAVGDHAGILGVECFFSQTFPHFRAKMPQKFTYLIIRSYHSGYTVSHPNCEVKHCWAQSVLRWGTTRESWVSNVF